LSSFNLLLGLKNLSPKHKKTPTKPIVQKKIEEYLYPFYGFDEFCTINPVKIGKTN
jgi:hypothetical protein